MADNKAQEWGVMLCTNQGICSVEPEPVKRHSQGWDRYEVIARTALQWKFLPETPATPILMGALEMGIAISRLVITVRRRRSLKN